MEGLETVRFLGARKVASILVGWEDNYISLWASGGKNAWKNIPFTHWITLQLICFNKLDYMTTNKRQQTNEEVFFLICSLLFFYYYI